MFTDNFVSLTKVLNVNTLIPYFIEKKIISFDDAADIKSCHQESEKIMKFLEYISKHLKTGHTDGFYLLLYIMKAHGTISTEMLANDMESSVYKLSEGIYVTTPYVYFVQYCARAFYKSSCLNVHAYMHTMT